MEERECSRGNKKSAKSRANENSYEYVKAVQQQFDDSKIKFSNDYYDILGLERPNGTEKEGEMFECEVVICTGVIVSKIDKKKDSEE